jgi:hypothetical protein
LLYPLSSIVLRQFPGSEDTGRDQQRALAALIHADSVTVSLFVRYAGGFSAFLP